MCNPICVPSDDVLCERINNLTTANIQLKLELRQAKKIVAYLRAGKPAPKRASGYDKLKKYPLHEVFHIIGTGRRMFVTDLEGIPLTVNTSSNRLLTFKKNVVCVGCGVRGSHFWVECNPGAFNYHLNLYGITKTGDEILMTRDHIIPKSKGGSDHLNNMQTMCTKCNNKKGNTVPSNTTVNEYDNSN
jgi:5-methylcytosine-specific restriction endonuclease McrA